MSGSIVIITQYFPPEMGAPQSRLLEMAKGLKNKGWDISIVSAMPNYPTGRIFKEFSGNFSTTEEWDGLPIKRLWLYASNSSSNLPRILSMLSFSFTSLFSFPFIKKRKADIIIVETPPLTLAFTAWMLAKLNGSKLILNVSDIWPLSAKELGAISDGFLYKRLEDLEKFLYKNADASLGQSQEIVDHLAKTGAKRSFLFRNGVDVGRFTVAASTKDSSKLRLIYAGLLGIAQGVAQICRSIDFKEIGLELHIYGDGAEKQELKNFLEQNPDRGIFLHDPVKRDQVPGILKSFDGTLIPLVTNLYGAVPSKIYEAMAAALPILFSGEGEGARIVSNNNLGWINKSGDIEKLKENIKEFKENIEKRNQISANALNAAKLIFDRSIQIENLHNFLKQEFQNEEKEK